jgi:uncharacterized protein
MKKIILLLSLILSQTITSQNCESLTKKFMYHMQRAEFDSCQTFYDTSLTNKVSVEMMKGMWSQMSGFLGEYSGYSDLTIEKKDSTELNSVRCNFEKTKLDLFLTYNTSHKLIGMFFKPAKNKMAYVEPSYVKTSKFYESKLSVKTGTYSMPGVLCIPNNIDNPPVAILLAGSGPNDKDESVGPNKPLKDIATGLASQGIATFRYDKRTLTYGSQFAKEPEKNGINEEVIEDALSAIALLKKNPLFAKSKIIIVGHSLGAMCAPLIAKRAKGLNGIVLMAGNARSLEDVVLEQYNYLFGLDSVDIAEKKEIEKYTAQLKNLKDPKLLAKAEAKDLPLEVHRYYWQSIKAYNQVEVAKKIKQPILILQGESDYQVTMTDFNLWKEALSSNKKNQFISYPLVNHLFAEGAKKSTPADYEKQSSVLEKVIKDLSAWIKTQN